MSSREKILEVLKKNQPAGSPLPSLPFVDPESTELIQKFTRTLGNIGGTAIEVSGWNEVEMYVNDRFSSDSRCVNMIPEMRAGSSLVNFGQAPHLLENVKLAILKGHFGVAENGAVWITDDLMGDRALPFICEHLALVIYSDAIFPTMQHAYEFIGASNYDLGTFIAGPSKTADIEQSLVLGAHGPKSMTVFLLTT